MSEVRTVKRRPNTPWPPEDLKTLRAFFAQGAEEVQARLKIWRTIDGIWVKARKLKLPGAHRAAHGQVSVSDDVIAEGRHLIAQGRSVYAASIELGFGESTLSQALQRADRDAKR